MRFADRADAGRRLAQLLSGRTQPPPVVVALPRGGVPVAAEIARTLGAPLDVLVVRKLGHPQQPELGVGAVGEGGVTVLNDALLRRAQVDGAALAHVEAREQEEVARRVARYRGDRPRAAVVGRAVILVDDGLATGFTARAAIEILRRAGAASVVLAVPVAPPETLADLRPLVDDIVCLHAPAEMWAIGQWYDDFSQTTDEEVTRLLAGAPSSAPAATTFDGEQEVLLQVGSRVLGATLAVPPDAPGLVLFAHGSGSSRHSPRNRYVAGVLGQSRLATLLFDLLTEDEAADRGNVFDVELLADRLLGAATWSRDQHLPTPIGFFGASTGAAAALLAAAQLGPQVGAVVSRGGRPDLAIPRLSEVRAPTLLVVGGRDTQVLELNRQAAEHLTGCEHEVAVVAGASHLFEEPGTLESAATLARDWFLTHLTGPSG
jgi:predicted phosphoribosyltransferase/predicted alpha/beta-hydrolase family hydrolase